MSIRVAYASMCGATRGIAERIAVRMAGAGRHAKPLRLFSGGPLGTQGTDAQGQDELVAAEPWEFAGSHELVGPSGTQVFFGAFAWTGALARDLAPAAPPGR